VPMLVGGVPFALLVLASPFVPRLERQATRWRDRYEKAFAASLVLLVLGVSSHFVLLIFVGAAPSFSHRSSSAVSPPGTSGQRRWRRSIRTSRWLARRRSRRLLLDRTWGRSLRARFRRYLLCSTCAWVIG